MNDVGVAAHIAGARLGSARYDAAMTAAARAGIDNGIWLCQTCGKKIDGDAVAWSVTDLLRRKVEVEHRARMNLGARPQRAPVSLTIEADACHYVKQYRAAFVPVHIINKSRRAVTIRSTWIVIDGVRHSPSKAIPNLVVPGLDWLAPPPRRLLAEDAFTGAWFFGMSFLGGGTCVDASPGSSAELFVAPVTGKVQRQPLIFLHPDDKQATVDRVDAFIPDDGSIR